MASRSLAGVGPGHHLFEFDDGQLRSGLCVIRLTEGTRTRTARAVLIRVIPTRWSLHDR
jgi:hypothetical protein